jgi:DNA-binding LacI/PurR family transcriptional regulator
VPADVAVVGFGDYEICRFTDPPLTSVNFDMPLTGRVAARRLLALISESDDGPWLMHTPTHLAVRGST